MMKSQLVNRSEVAGTENGMKVSKKLVGLLLDVSVMARNLATF